MKRLTNSLFGKIFLWFCLTLVAGALGNVLVMDLLDTRHIRVPDHPQAREMFALQSRLLLDAYAHEGEAGIRRYVDLAPGLRFFMRLFDAQGRELTGFGPHPGMEDDFFGKMRETLRGREDQEGYAEGSLPPFFVTSRPLPGGEPVYLAVEYPRLPPPPGLLGSWMFWKRQVPMLLAGGVLALLLARHLVGPVRRLREATRRVAGGDLTHRIGAGGDRGYEEINALSEDFDRMAERVEHLVLSQRRLLRDISHELRSPLTRLNVALELARKRTGDTARAELDRIGLDAGRLEELIGQLLAYTRLDHMRECPETTRVNLGALLLAVVRDTDLESQYKGVCVQVDTGTPAMIDAVPELVRRALENVLRNAIRFTPAGGTVRVVQDVEPAPEEAGRHGAQARVARVTVLDMGPGVPGEALDKLFLPFYRVGDARGHKSGGSGIGLAIAQRAILLHGGTIAAGNLPQGGLRVDITLPLAD